MTFIADKFDPHPILAALAQRDVEFIVIGGIAAAARGSDALTADLDVCYRRTKENIARLLLALRDLQVTLTNSPPKLPFTLDERTIWNGDTFTFDTPYGRFDCLANPSGTTGYDDLVRSATTETIGVSVLVCSLDDLIRMKKAGRPKDLWAVEQLTTLKRLIESSSPSDT